LLPAIIEKAGADFATAVTTVDHITTIVDRPDLLLDPDNLRHIQCDEIWSFVYAKQKNVATARRQDRGRALLFVLIYPLSLGVRRLENVAARYK
jgi:hypothetical protein